MHHSDTEEPGDVATDASYTMDERGVRKLLFKKRSTSSTCAVSSMFLLYELRFPIHQVHYTNDYYTTYDT